jgi:hypothetical protein
MGLSIIATAIHTQYGLKHTNRPLASLHCSMHAYLQGGGPYGAFKLASLQWQQGVLRANVAGRR